MFELTSVAANQPGRFQNHGRKRVELLLALKRPLRQILQYVGIFPAFSFGVDANVQTRAHLARSLGETNEGIKLFEHKKRMTCEQWSKINQTKDIN